MGRKYDPDTGEMVDVDSYRPSVETEQGVPNWAQRTDFGTGDPRFTPSILHGVMEGTAGLGGMVDLATTGLDWAGVPVDPTNYAGQIREQFPDWLQDFQPEGTQERIRSGLANAGTSFMVPGAGGLGYIRALAPGARALATGGLAAGARQYGKSAVADYGTHAARLGGANVGANLGAQFAQAKIDEDNTLAQMAIPILAGAAGSPVGARMASAPKQRRAVRAARDVAQNVPRSRSLTMEAMDRLTKRITGRLASGEVTDHDVLRAREVIQSALTGRGNPITQAQIDAAREAGDVSLATTLEAQRSLMSDVMEELRLAANLQNQQGIVPTSVGVIEGAGIDAGRPLTAMHRATAADRGDFVQDALRRNELSRAAAEQEATNLRPGATGTSGSIRDAARASARETIDEASVPFREGGEFEELLDQAGRIPLHSVDTKMRRLRQNLTPAEDRFDTQILRRIDAHSDLAEFDAGTRNVRKQATISPRDLRALTQDLDAKINRMDPSPERSQLVQQRQALDALLLSRAPSDVRARARQIKQQYSQMKDRYEPGPLKGRERLDAGKRSARRGAQSLLYKETGDPIRDIVKSENPVAAAREAKKIMGNNPDRIAELEAGLWAEIFDAALDADSTIDKVKTAQKAARPGSGLIEAYREVAGDAKANQIENILKRMRQSRVDTSVKSGAEFGTGSAGLAGESRGMIGNPADLMAMDSSTTVRVVGVLAKIALGGDEVGLSRIITQAMRDPEVMHEVLSMPTREGFEAWKKQIARHAARTGVREGGKVQTDE